MADKKPVVKAGSNDDFTNFINILIIIVLLSMVWGAFQADLAKHNGIATTTASETVTAPVQNTVQYSAPTNPLYTNQGNTIYSSQYVPSH